MKQIVAGLCLAGSVLVWCFGYSGCKVLTCVMTNTARLTCPQLLCLVPDV